MLSLFSQIAGVRKEKDIACRREKETLLFSLIAGAL
jgi:hypothetical protein